MIMSVPAIAVYGSIGLVDYMRSFTTADRSGRLARIGAVAAVLLASLAGVGYWLSGAEVENWRGAARHVFDRVEPGDQVLFANDSVRLFFEYYRTEGAGESSVDPTPAYPPQPWGEYGTGDHQYRSFDRALVQEVARRHDRIWVVVGRDHTRTDGVDAALTALDEDFTLVDEREFNGRVDVLQYERHH